MWRTLSRSDDIGAVWLCDFSPVDEGVDPSPGGTLTRVLGRLWREVDGSEPRDLRRVGGEQLFD